MKNIIVTLKKICGAVIFLVMGITAYSQTADYVTFSGKIIDAKNRNEIYYATVSIPGTNIATVSNSEGEFTIKFPRLPQPNELEISHISYGIRRIPITFFNPAQSVVIELEPSAITLSEIRVNGASAKDIVMEAIRRIPYNYPENPMMLTGFYRESIKQRRNYISISEAVVDIYKSSYRQGFDSDRLKLNKARQGVNVKKADTLGVKFQGGPNISLMLDVAKYPHYLFYDLKFDYYEFTIMDMITVNNRAHYVISFKQNPQIVDPLYLGQIYIDAENYAITHAQFQLNLENPSKAEWLFVRKKPLGVRFVPLSTFYLVNFTEQNGKYYFSYARNELSFKTVWNRRLFSSKYHITAEMVITDRDTNDIVKFPKSETFKTSEALLDAASAFTDDDFWGNDNIIKPEEDIEKAIQRYGKKLKRTYP